MLCLGKACGGLGIDPLRPPGRDARRLGHELQEHLAHPRERPQRPCPALTRVRHHGARQGAWHCVWPVTEHPGELRRPFMPLLKQRRILCLSSRHKALDELLRTPAESTRVGDLIQALLKQKERVLEALDTPRHIRCTPLVVTCHAARLLSHELCAVRASGPFSRAGSTSLVRRQFESDTIEYARARGTADDQ